MPISLKAAITLHQPSHTKGSILLHLNSSNGARIVHIVVEDNDDIDVYGKMFNHQHVCLYTSETENNLRGCAYLEQIVEDVLKQKPNAYIIGIRDADYLRYVHVNYEPPRSIFVTDQRDLEMMLLSSQNVKHALISWNAHFEQAMTRGFELARYKGLLRICNDIHQLGCNFKKKFKQSDIWDEHNHKIKPDWKNIMTQTFLSNCNIPCDKNILMSIMSSERFETESVYNICQGHDVIRYLSMLMIRQEYAQSAIMSTITQAFDRNDFYKTYLWKEIEKWARIKDVNLT
ncbi:MAG: hypothetical protein II985_00245 [Alistipes sp.]|nr:hypothetical protein [Alistipes sp.]